MLWSNWTVLYLNKQTTKEKLQDSKKTNDNKPEKNKEKIILKFDPSHETKKKKKLGGNRDGGKVNNN